MSLAWGSLVLLIVLPGILFFVGTYLPEQFTREAEPRSPLGQLAGALLIAFAIHGFSYAILGGVCGGALPCISIETLLRTISVDVSVPGEVRAVGDMLNRFRWWIFVYLMATSGVGLALGYLYGRLTSKQIIRGLSRHPWVHSLNVDGLTYAYVLTNLQHADRILMYKGFLKAFGLQQDGRFSYLVLTQVARLYLHLGSLDSTTSTLDAQLLIGESAPPVIDLPSAPRSTGPSAQSLFVIEGEDIANVVFDVMEIKVAAVSKEELDRIVKSIREEVNVQID